MRIWAKIEIQWRGDRRTVWFSPVMPERFRVDGHGDQGPVEQVEGGVKGTWISSMRVALTVMEKRRAWSLGTVGAQGIAMKLRSQQRPTSLFERDPHISSTRLASPLTPDRFPPSLAPDRRPRRSRILGSLHHHSSNLGPGLDRPSSACEPVFKREEGVCSSLDQEDGRFRGGKVEGWKMAGCRCSSRKVGASYTGNTMNRACTSVFRREGSEMGDAGMAWR